MVGLAIWFSLVLRYMAEDRSDEEVDVADDRADDRLKEWAKEWKTENERLRQAKSRANAAGNKDEVARIAKIQEHRKKDLK